MGSGKPKKVPMETSLWTKTFTERYTYFPYSSCYEKMAELFFIHSDFSLTPLLINDFSLNHKNLYYIHIHANSVLFYAYREKLDSKRSLEIFSHQDGFLHKHDSRLVWSDRLAFQKRISRWKWISKAPGRVAKICSFLCFNLKKNCCRKMVTNYN